MNEVSCGCRGAGAAAVVFDITDTDSFAKAQYWVSELQKTASPDIGATDEALAM